MQFLALPITNQLSFNIRLLLIILVGRQWDTFYKMNGFGFNHPHFRKWELVSNSSWHIIPSTIFLRTHHTIFFISLRLRRTRMKQFLFSSLYSFFCCYLLSEELESNKFFLAPSTVSLFTISFNTSSFFAFGSINFLFLFTCPRLYLLIFFFISDFIFLLIALSSNIFFIDVKVNISGCFFLWVSFLYPLPLLEKGF